MDAMENSIQLDPTDLRKLALTCYVNDDYFNAEEILRFLLKEEFEVPSTYLDTMINC